MKTKRNSAKRRAHKKPLSPIVLRKNPQTIEYYLKNIKEGNYLLLGQGGQGKIYKISSNKVLKLFHKPIRNDRIQYLLALSNAELIPHIYEINSYFMIMKVIEGIVLDKIIFKLNYFQKKKIYSELIKQINTWHSSGFTHCNISRYNILIDKDFNPIIIDPYGNPCDVSDDLSDLNYLSKFLV